MSNKYIIGFHNGFESGIALLKNGNLVEAVSEERFNLKKNYAGIPVKSYEYIIKKYKIKNYEIKNFIYSRVTFQINWDKYHEKLDNKIKKIRNKKIELKELENKFKSECEDQKFLKEFIDFLKKKNIPQKKIIFLEHHKAHAWSAFSCSPFKDAYILTSDGRGDFKSSTFSHANLESGLKEYDFITTMDSLAFLYGQITELLGFIPHRHEGKITGLAAYGNYQKTIKIFRKILNWNNVEDQWVSNFKFYSPYNNIKNKNFRKIFKGYKKEDIAAGVQKHCEDLVIKYLTIMLKKKKVRKKINLCLAGGLFANVKINQKVRELKLIKNIFVFPNMGDGGLSIGGLGYYKWLNGKKKINFDHVYLGSGYTKKDYYKLLKNTSKKKFIFQKIKNMPEKVSNLLNKNFILGLFIGRMEFGPRALGARSIIANARDKNINHTLNKRLNRTEFMPFAPVTMFKDASKCYIDWNSDHVASKYMTVTYNCTKKFIRKHPAVVHVDKTARPQILKKKENILYYQILNTYCKKYDEMALINTSFNTHESPIIENPSQALKALEEKRIDYLVLEDFLIKLNE